MSDYWKERIAQEMLYRQKEDTQIGAEMTKLFNRQYQAIQDEIDLFMKKYGDGQKITPAEAKKRVSEMDVVNFADKAKRYVQEKNFSPEANAELKIYNLKMKVSRFEMLQYHIDLEMVALADGERQIAEKYLNQTFVQEMNLQAGILGEFVQSPKVITHLAKAIIDTPYDGVVWSDRIWERQTALRLLVANSVQGTILRGRNAVTMARFLKQQFDVTGYQAKRLAVTETARVQTQVQKEMYKANQVGKYEFMAEPTACEICAKLDGKTFDTDDMTPGKNAAPMHPHCHCSTGPSVTKERLDLDKELDAIWHKKYPNMDNVTNEHLKKKNGSGNLEILSYVDIEGKRYMVDGYHVVSEHTNYEHQVANWLSRKLNEHVALVPRINIPENLSTPDYLISGVPFDLKIISGNGKNVIDNNAKKAKKQAPNLIFDITKTSLPEEEILSQINDVYRSGRRGVSKVVVKNKDDLLYILIPRK